MLGRMSAVGQHVAAARKRAGLTQKQLGALAGVDPNHLSRIERGVAANAMQSTLDGIAGAVGISTAELMAGQVERVKRKSRRALAQLDRRLS